MIPHVLLIVTHLQDSPVDPGADKLLSLISSIGMKKEENNSHFNEWGYMEALV